jgi:hypothetical protein
MHEPSLFTGQGDDGTFVPFTDILPCTAAASSTGRRVLAVRVEACRRPLDHATASSTCCRAVASKIDAPGALIKSPSAKPGSSDASIALSVRRLLHALVRQAERLDRHAMRGPGHFLPQHKRRLLLRAAAKAGHHGDILFTVRRERRDIALHGGAEAGDRELPADLGVEGMSYGLGQWRRMDDADGVSD